MRGILPDVGAVALLIDVRRIHALVRLALLRVPFRFTLFACVQPFLKLVGNPLVRVRFTFETADLF